MQLVEDNGKVYKWVIDNLKENMIGLKNDLTIGILDDSLILAGVIYSVIDNICYMTIYSDNKRWITRANLSRLFELPFDCFDIDIIRAVTSHKNKKANRFLRRLKLREEGYLRFARKDGSHEVVFSLTLKELRDKKRCKWYKEI